MAEIASLHAIVVVEVGDELAAVVGELGDDRALARQNFATADTLAKDVVGEVDGARELAACVIFHVNELIYVIVRITGVNACVGAVRLAREVAFVVVFVVSE